MPRIITDEFTKDFVAHVQSGMFPTQVSADLEFSKTALQNCVRDARVQSHGITPSADPDEHREMSQDLKRICELPMENEVLRTAAASLSQPQHRSPNSLACITHDVAARTGRKLISVAVTC